MLRTMTQQQTKCLCYVGAQAVVIMCNLRRPYLRCRLSARCEGMSEGAGEGFDAAFEVCPGIDRPRSETRAGMKTSWNNQTKTVSLPPWCSSLLMSALHTVARINLDEAKVSGWELTCKTGHTSVDKYNMFCLVTLLAVRTETKKKTSQTAHLTVWIEMMRRWSWNQVKFTLRGRIIMFNLFHRVSKT